MIDSDSDSELLNGDVFTFQNETKTFSVRGPKINSSNLAGTSFRNNTLSSTMQMARNLGRQKFTESHYAEQGMYHRRATSPVSVKSACDMRQRNFNNMFNSQAMSSQGSCCNCRSRSPMSIRSIDSTATMSAVDVVTALKTNNFNKNELRLIKDEIRKFMKHNARKRIEKRKIIRQFLKGGRRVSSGDSGDQASDSSISSDEMSSRSYYKGNMSSCRSTKTDISVLRKKLIDNNMFKDCTDNFRQHSTRSLIASPADLNNTQPSKNYQRSMATYMKISSFNRMPVCNLNDKQVNTNAVMLQKDRFKNGFQLPSKRFNMSVACTKIPEDPEYKRSGDLQNRINCPSNSSRINSGTNRINSIKNGMNSDTEASNSGTNRCNNVDSDSDQYELFSETNPNKDINSICNVQRKIQSNSDPSIDTDCVISPPSQEVPNKTSQCKNIVKAIKPISKETHAVDMHNKNNTNDFVFAKPTFPVKKYSQEKIISKSASLMDTSVHVTVNKQKSQHVKLVEPEENIQEDELSEAAENTTDIAMRPSFIKRKLFTQRLDVSEKKNISIDNLDGPQNSIYGAIEKEKNKARKLQQVTTQSCLSRDVQQDDHNLLDLIHKIVPLEHMNATNQTNRTEFQTSNNKTEENEDKWDVTSIISTQNNNETLSDTFTDEEIFNATVNNLAKEKVSKKITPVKVKKSKILVEKLPYNANSQQKQKSNAEKHDIANNKIDKCIKSFWDTDFESDAESHLPNKNVDLKENRCKDIANNKIDKRIKSFWDTDFESDAESHLPNKNVDLKENRCKDIPNTKKTTKTQGLCNKLNFEKPITASSSNDSKYFNNTVKTFGVSTFSVKSHRTTKRKKLNSIDENSGISTAILPQSKKQKVCQANSTIELTKSEETKKSTIGMTLNCEIKDPTHSVKLPPKKVIDANKKKVKTIENEPKTHNNKKEITDNKPPTNQKKTITVQTAQKSNRKHRNDNILMEEKNVTHDNRKTSRNKQVNNKNKETTKSSNIIHNEEQSTTLLNNNNKENPAKDDLKTKRTNRTSQITDKLQSKRMSPKKKRINKITLNHDSFVSNNSENNNSYNQRPVRTCRISKGNLNNTRSNLNESLTKSLRSKQIDLSSISNEHVAIIPKKNVSSQDSRFDKSRLNDVSVVEKNSVYKKAVTNRSKLLDIDTNAKSITRSQKGAVLPKKKVSEKSPKNAKGKKQNGASKLNTYEKTTQSNKISLNYSRPARNRKPSKRYSIL